MRVRQKWTMVLVGVPMLVAVALGTFLMIKSLVASGGPGQAVPASRPSSQDSPPPSSAAPPACGQAATVDVAGNPLGELEPLVLGIHDAACRGDYQGLLPFMDDFREVPKQDVVAEWERDDSDGYLLRVVAETFEIPPVGDQGGHFFCHPDGAVAVIARGTYDRPGLWSDFDLARQSDAIACGRVR